ncbi:MAG TPA: beta-ketoacyl-ACP synthase III [Candidatus Angelobacter sp.]|jgi:3-oxoacyl-[acyl-carrier-protein] synthase-3|nr:beta-ketoacyl-ACP synthase III [Candidatus Angelobacter sp.]
MSLIPAKISGLGTYVPPRLLTNSDLEQMIDTSDAWLIERTGIRQRHIVDQGVASSDLAVEAVKELLHEHEVDPASVEAIFVATVTPDMMFPSTACLVQKRIGAKGAWGFDLSAACSGFLYAVQTGVKFVEGGAHKRVLVIGVDVMSSIVNYRDRSTCVIFGDGAGAVLIEPATGPEGLIDFLHEVDGSGCCSLYMPGGGSRNPASCETVKKEMHYVHLERQAVFKYAVRKLVETSQCLLQRNGYSAKDVALFVPNQSNSRIVTASAERLGLDPERYVLNIDEYGNTAAASVPLALHTARKQGRLNKGDLVLMATVGAGFTAGAALMRWAY